MYEERGKTLPDGRIEVIVSDPSTGQEVVRYYSPGAEPKVSLADLVLKDGFLRDELMPPSVAKKDDLTPLATKEELRNATKGLLARSEVMDGDKIKSSLLPAPNVTAADGSSLLGSDGKIRHDLLPEGAGGSTEGGSVDLQPLEKRVAALENAPKGEGGGNSLGVYDKSVYTKVVNESELLSQLTSEQRGNYERLNRLCRAAFCWKNLSGVKTWQDTAAKIVLEDGTVFLRLTDGKLYSNVGGAADVSSASFYCVSTLQKVDFFRVHNNALGNENHYDQYIVVQADSNTEDLPIESVANGGVVGRSFMLDMFTYLATPLTVGGSAEVAERAKSTADEAKETADNAKAKADEAKTAADGLKHTVDGLVSDAESFSTHISENASEIRRVERIANEASVKLGKLSEGLVTDRFEISEGEEVRGDEEGNYLPLIFFHRVHSDVCINLGQGRFKLLNSGLCVQFYQDERDSTLWHERQYYTFMDGEVEENVLDYRVGENRRWRVVGRHPSSKSTREKVKELFGL